MFTDIVGFSRLTIDNPLRARELNEEHQKIVRNYLGKYQGNERQTTGDGFFLEFKSATEAMQCAIDIQQDLHDRNLTRSSESQIQIRIGLHIGDVFEKDQDLFGEGVNFAARLEPLAEPGGICVSKMLYELVKSNWPDNRFISMGVHQLKNISTPTEVFRFQFSWQKRSDSLKQKGLQLLQQLDQQKQWWPLISLFVMGLSLLAFIIGKAFLPQFQKDETLSRNPSSIREPATETMLNKNWLYRLDSSDNIAAWNEYNIKGSWRYADQISGAYEMKNEFQVVGTLLEPTILLGLFSDSHRVYLNGNFIGGSDHLSDLSIYSFDSRLLRPPPETNTLLVKAKTRPSLNPGLVMAEGLPPRLGEFSEIKSLQNSYFFKFYILKNIYFVFSFVIFLLSLTYAIYIKNKNEIFYSSLFLLVSCLGYAYYNPWVNSTFDYPFLRFLRVSSIVVSSLVLYTGYLASKQRLGLCTWNNFAAAFVGVFCFFAFNFYPFQSAADFVSLYNRVLFVGLIYIGVASLIGIANEISHFTKNRKSNGKFADSLESLTFLLFTLLSLCSFLGSFKNAQSEIFFSAATRTVLNDIGIMSPFFFALTRITMAVFEFTLQKRQAILNRKKDDFFIEITRIISDGASSIEKINRIQKLAQNFLRSENSALFLLDPVRPTELRLHSNFDHSKGRNEKSPQASALRVPMSAGLFGHLAQNKRALLIEDLRNDYRFHSIASLDFIKYRSGSCLAYPLVSNDQFRGALLFFDKENGKRFEMNDLENGLRMSAFVALLLSSTEEIKVAI